MYLIYSLLFTFGLLLALPYYLVRRNPREALRHVKERFGIFPAHLRPLHLRPAHLRQPQRGAILVHGVSLGETLALVPLVRRLQERYPDRAVFLTHSTPTGRQAGREQLKGVTAQFYLPLDWRWTMRRLMRFVQPELVVVGETELWPNLFRAARESGARLVIANARLSDRSFPRYRLARRFFRRVLADVDYIFAQSENDRNRFLALGARPDRVVTTGSTKYELSPPKGTEFSRRLGECLQATVTGRRRRPVMFAASTMPGEEEKVLQAWREIHSKHPKAFLVIAPRRPERFDEAARILESHGIEYLRRSLITETTDWTRAEALLLDSIGELASLFERCDLAFIGGSLVETGGHNPLEPAYWAKPVLFGPHMENFREIARRFVGAGGAIQVSGAQGLAREALRLLEDPARARAMGDTGRRLVEENQGATARSLAHIETLIQVRTPECTELKMAQQAS